MHLSKNKYTAKNHDAVTREGVIAMIKQEKPELIIFTGDIINGEFCRDAKLLFRNFLKKIDNLKISWALIFGNHDDTGNASRKELMEILSKFKYCLSSSGPANVNGIGNFQVLIQNIKNQEEFSLYFLDYGKDNKKFKYDWVHKSQSKWFKKLNAKHSKLPGFIFLHIPLKEFKKTRGIFQGKKLESVDPSRHTTTFFNEILNTKNIIAVFCGHDHYNSYCTKYKGVNLCYGKNSGFDFYSDKLSKKRGARIININFNDRKILHTKISFFPVATK